eukprot:Opistho-2@21427
MMKPARGKSSMDVLRITTKNDPYTDTIAAMKVLQTDQLKAIAARTDAKVAMLDELQDFMKRKGEIELEYATKMERLVEKFNARRKGSQTIGRVAGSGHWIAEMTEGGVDSDTRGGPNTTTDAWTCVLDSHKRVAKMKSVLATTLSDLGDKLTMLSKETAINSKQCIDAGTMLMDEFKKTMVELEEAGKSYHGLETKSQQAKTKYEEAERKKSDTKGTLTKLMGKDFVKEADKMREALLQQERRALLARNEYILTVQGANAHRIRYFESDIISLIDVLDRKYHDTFSNILHDFVKAENDVIFGMQTATGDIKQKATNVDALFEKAQFIKENELCFVVPGELPYIAQAGDAVTQIVFQSTSADTLRERKGAISNAVQRLSTEIEELTRALAACAIDSENPTRRRTSENSRKRGGDPDSKYIEIFTGLTLKNDELARLVAQMEAMDGAVDETGANVNVSLAEAKTPRRGGDKKKVYGEHIGVYTESTGRRIPFVVESCIGALERLNAREREGLFRISGGTNLINQYKAHFDNGEDPMRDIQDAECVHAIAGVMKLYFRELPDPLFTFETYDKFIACARIREYDQVVSGVRESLRLLPQVNYDTLEFLITYLYKVSQNHAQNKMHPPNLAIVFGPTLLRPPATNMTAIITDAGHQGRLVELLIKECNWIFGKEGATASWDVPVTAEVTQQEEAAIELCESYGESMYENVPKYEPIYASTKTLQRSQSAELGTEDEADDDAPPPPPPDADNPELAAQLQSNEPPVIDTHPPPAAAGTSLYASPMKPPKPAGARPEAGALRPDMGELTAAVQKRTPSFSAPSAPLPPTPGQANMQPPAQAPPPPPTAPPAQAYEEMDNDVPPPPPDEDAPSTVDADGDMTPKFSARALYAYTAASDTELGFGAGDVLSVLEPDDDGWWKCQDASGAVAYAPASYLERIEG